MITRTVQLFEENKSADLRSRILTAAASLIATGGTAALTTRSVAAAAETQGPTIYRLFGDKRGLMDALAEHALTEYSANTAQRARHDDPAAELRASWDEHIAFGLAHGAIYFLMNAIGRPDGPSPAARAGMKVLGDRVRRVAAAGRLRVSEERAVALIHAAGIGTVIALLETAPEGRDPGLSVAAREMVMAAILSDPPTEDLSSTARIAAALRASIGTTQQLSAGEGLLLDEMLQRLSTPPLLAP